MIILMEENSGCYSIECFCMWLKIFIHKIYRNFFFAVNVFSYFWNAETSFVVCPFFTIDRRDMGIDKNPFVTCIIWILFLFFFIKTFNDLNTIHNKQPYIFIYLRSCKSYALAVVRGLPYIFN